MKAVKESVSQSVIETIQEYYEVTEQIKLLEKRKRELRPEVESVASSSVFVAANFIVTRTERTVSYLDKEKLVASLGAEVVKGFERLQVQEVLSVKRINQ